MVVTVAFRYGGIALQFLILLVLARHLAPEDYGRYMFVLSAVLPTYFLLGFGASEAFVRDAPALMRRDEGSSVARMAGATLWLALGSAGFVVLVGFSLLWLAPVAPSAHVVIAFIVAFFVANGLMFNGAQLLLGSGAERLAAFFYYPAVNISLALSAVPYVLIAGHPTFGTAAVVTCGAALIMAAIALTLALRQLRPQRPSRAVLGRQVRIGLRLSAARALYAAGIWAPTFVAGMMLTPVEAGQLGTAGRLAVAVGAVMAAVRFVIRPTIVRAFDAGDTAAIKTLTGRVSTVTVGLAVLALILSMTTGAGLIRLTFGADLEPAAPLLTILLVSVLVEAFAGPVDEVLKMTGNDHYVLAVFGVAVPVSILAMMASASHGLAAIAWIQVAYTVVVFGSMIVFVRRALGVWLHPSIPQFLKGPAPRSQLVDKGADR